ncbi:hypothetical protein D9M68_938610 [compost metagenome]
MKARQDIADIPTLAATKASTGSDARPAKVLTSRPAAICRNPMSDEAVPAILGKGASVAVVMAGPTKALPKVSSAIGSMTVR